MNPSNSDVMAKTSNLSAPERRRIAEQALDSPEQRTEDVLVRVQCGRGHHVAAVLGTAVGPVFRSVTGLHAHGDRDYVDTGHGSHQNGTRYVDLLAADDFTDDALPASCECGPHTLSRARLVKAIADYERVIQLP